MTIWLNLIIVLCHCLNKPKESNALYQSKTYFHKLYNHALIDDKRHCILCDYLLYVGGEGGRYSMLSFYLFTYISQLFINIVTMLVKRQYTLVKHIDNKFPPINLRECIPYNKGTNHSRWWASFSLTGFVCLIYD